MAADFFTGDLFARVRQAVRPGRTPVVGRGAPTDRALYQAASLLLDYPTTELVEQVPTMRALVDELGGPARSLLPLLDRLESEPLTDLQTEYVETFDMRRRCCLYLTYYQHGDTRKRGSALLAFVTAYKLAGAVMSARELPDHLGVVLEFGAQHDLDRCRGLLVNHRPGLETLRISLTDRRSEWAGVVSAVTATLPPIDGEGHEAVRKLIAQGPPDEDVGLEAFTSSSYLESGAHP
ncbi:nitrate reductase molybdenum cofactor assembly chaperone [Dietzia cinnamea]|uniref:nitrate reductase molybdenum cofactor assembly chaperone n=1 Tax=Dietzia cinnamea TaxID=321318 RepID=UPI0021A52F16|nr:nitrate reductase molybdenum cofactor assembly chaperone [Dietzia cinnamea]MCT1713385.1 nitrate reductase molybdenum cofactor assembly chaperone [Dietzia cinnamea]